jgi:hypothetical protein
MGGFDAGSMHATTKAGWVIAFAGLVAVAPRLHADAEILVSSTRPGSAPDWAAGLDANVEWSRGVYVVDELIRHTSQQTHTPYVIGPDVGRSSLDQSVRVPMFAGRGYQAVLLVAAVAGLDAYLADELVIYLPKGELPQVLRGPQRVALHDHTSDLGLDTTSLLTRIGQLDLVDASLSSAADAMIREYGVPVVLSPDVRATQALVLIRGSGLPLADALAQFEASTGISASVRWGMLWWSVGPAESVVPPALGTGSAPRGVELQAAPASALRAAVADATGQPAVHRPPEAPEGQETSIDARGAAPEVWEASELARRSRR